MDYQDNNGLNLQQLISTIEAIAPSRPAASLDMSFWDNSFSVALKKDDYQLAGLHVSKLRFFLLVLLKLFFFFC